MSWLFVLVMEGTTQPLVLGRLNQKEIYLIFEEVMPSFFLIFYLLMMKVVMFLSALDCIYLPLTVDEVVELMT